MPSSFAMSLPVILTIAVGGAFGAVARHWISNSVDHWLQSDLPLGTLTVNVLGSFLFGLLSIVIIKSQMLGEHSRLLLLTGGLGAFTTFSTFSMETLNLLMDERLLMAIINVLVNVVVCVLAAWFGLSLAQRF